MSTTLLQLSPLDGRYAQETQDVRNLFNEFSLMQHRLEMEVKWWLHLAKAPDITELNDVSTETKQTLTSLLNAFSLKDAERIKALEQQTRHDVKAIEYFLREQFDQHRTLKSGREFIHFALTSADVNNIAYALMLKRAKSNIIQPALSSLSKQLSEIIEKTRQQAMLSRTHGQPASPTTLGKEMSVFFHRLARQASQLNETKILAKCNGAVGNFSAHHAAYPLVDWPSLSRKFIESLGLAYSSMTTQIEPHDTLAEHCHILIRIHTICIDLCRDMWSYISLGYFSQHVAPGQIGSSTMPHKINPIKFENAEGNFGIANALLDFMANKLPCSRFQRDLTDSTVIRNFGVALGHSLLGIKNLTKGLQQISPNHEHLTEEVNNHWEVLAEPVQMVMRQHGVANAYEQLKQLTQGQALSKKEYMDFVSQLDLPQETKSRLSKLTPADYVGLANQKQFTDKEINDDHEA